MEVALHNAIQTFIDSLQHALPDYLLWVIAPVQRTLQYCLGAIIDGPGRFPWWGLAAALCIAAGAFLLDRNRSAGGVRAFLRFCFPREIYRSQSAWVDLKVGFFNYVLFGGGALNLTWRLTTAFFASWITKLLVAGFGPIEHPAGWGPISVVLFMLALSMASDFGYFLFHWLSHVFPPMWAIHKLHHSAEVMTPLTAARVHAFERVLMGPFISAATGLLVGPMLYLHGGETSALTIFGLDVGSSMFFILGHNLHHSHVWVYFGPIIGRIIVSPAQHQIHHSCLPRHLDKNFAEHWSFWDAIFGTLYLPRERETLTLGLAGYATQPHPGVLAANIRPVVDSVKACVSIAWRLFAAIGALRLRNDHLVPSLMAGQSAESSQGLAQPPGPGR